jgi:hypothetical protein
LLLLLTKHHAMKTYRLREKPLHTLLTSALAGSEWLASHLGHSNPGDVTLKACVGPRAGLDPEVKRKIFFLYRESRPQSATMLTEPSRLLWNAHKITKKLFLFSPFSSTDCNKICERNDYTTVNTILKLFEADARLNNI